MSTLTWSCCPCWLWLASSSFDSMSAMAPARSSRRPRESVASLAELSADLRNQVLAWLPAVALARMQAASGPFADCGRAALSARGLASLRVLHWLEAQALSFAWGGGAGIDALQVSGDDGWLTEFGSARITCTEVAALDAARPRCRWELELLRHDGLLVVGVADERMQDNVFVGVFSDGGWASVGWELPHQGGLQPVDSSRSIPLPLLRPLVHLRPARGRRVVLGLHFKRSPGYAVLELSARLQEGPDGPWTWHFLDAVSIPHFPMLRPAVSTNIGANVRLLNGDAEI
mmetsp:Transcript_27375/g.69258  ORF Transcript_27375/g.69258 Transcript_27375/m.69258 type:complete len:288 (+) Transcript_27375:162-1025(+)